MNALHWKEFHVEEFPKGNVPARAYAHKLVPLRVMVSVSIMEDASEWIHLSVSRPDRDPSWQEMVKVRDEFLGDEEAVMVLPKKEHHVNLHSHCFHWWKHVRGTHTSIPGLHKIKWETRT
jgi:hypothetical protein